MDPSGKAGQSVHYWGSPDSANHEPRPQEAAAHPAPTEVEPGELTQPLAAWPVVTFTITALNAAIWLLMELQGGSQSVQVLTTYGAKHSQLIAAGELWRLLTPAFLHIGLMHLLVNSFSLLSLGARAEGIFGRKRFLALYLVAAVSGNGLSFLLTPALSAGASGAIFGIAGALVVYYWLHRDEHPVQRNELRELLINLAINGGYGLVVARIDNWAHAGGFVGGMALGFALRPRGAALPEIGEVERTPTFAASPSLSSRDTVTTWPRRARRQRPAWVACALALGLAGGTIWPLIWFGLTWADMRAELQDSEMHPWWHALSLIVPIYGLFRVYEHFATTGRLVRSIGAEVKVHAGWAVAVTIGSLAAQAIAASVEGEQSWLASLLIFGSMGLIGLVLAHGQAALNAYWSALPEGPLPKRVHWAEWLFISLGIPLNALAVFAPAVG